MFVTGDKLIEVKMLNFLLVHFMKINDLPHKKLDPLC